MFRPLLYSLLFSSQFLLAVPSPLPSPYETLSKQEFQSILDSISWFHSIDFGNGVVSKGTKSLKILEAEASAFFDGLDLTNQSVLDIGAWNGAISFEAKRRGALRVLATDKCVWTLPEFSGTLEMLNFTIAKFGLDIEVQEIDVPDICPESVGTFDVVLFLGVFYHLFDAPTLTKQISKCACDLLIIETHLDALLCNKPAMIFYPGAALSNDPTNWWGPNPQVIYEILRELGFSHIYYQDHPICGMGRGIFHAFRNQDAVSRLLKDDTKPWIDLSNPKARAKIFHRG